MKSFEYGDEWISDKQLMIAIPAIAVGVTILSIPRGLADSTIGVDGLLSLIIGGIIAGCLIWFIAKFVCSFSNQTFYDYTSTVITKPVAVLVFFLFSLGYIFLTAFSVRSIANVTSLYLLDETPIEILGLIFLFVIMYAVAGSRAGLFRLNMMFFPFILVISLLLFIFNIRLVELKHFQPILQTDIQAYWEGVIAIYGGVVGPIGIVLFYTVLVKKTDKIPKLAVIGTSIPVMLYMLFYIMTIGVFGNVVTGNLIYPAIELAKSVEIPGGVFERFESIFSVIWFMAIFNTAAMTFDIAVLTLNHVFHTIKKVKLVLILAPIIYLISMQPQDIVQLEQLGDFSVFGVFIYTIVIVFAVFVIAKIRGVKAGE